MESIPIFRGSHLRPYLDELNELGVPVEARLARADLPSGATARAGHYLPLRRAIECLERCAREKGIDDLPLRGALRSQAASVAPGLARALRAATTLDAAVRAVCSFAGPEAPCARWELDLDDTTVRVLTRVARPLPDAARRYHEWYANVAMVRMVRSFAGPHWQPAELLFESVTAPGDLALDCFPRTRLRTAAPCAGIVFPRSLLGLKRKATPGLAHGCLDATPPAPRAVDFVESLKLLLEAYLRDRPVSVNFAADLAGTSVRTLQRRVKAAGLSYSDLLQRARFDAAAGLLKSGNRRIIDVACELGWSDPSHFARAFRRSAGMSPRQFRSQPGS